MPYEPTEWKSGDVVTSAKLNKIEAGIASGGVLVVTDNDGTLDKTWQEIFNADIAILSSFDSVSLDRGTALISSVYLDNGAYYVVTATTIPLTYTTDSASGYPARSGG